MAGEIEFLDDDGAGGPDRRDEDLLENAPPPRWPRWVVAAGAVAVAGAVATGIMLQGDGEPHAAPTFPGTQTALPSDHTEIVPLPAEPPVHSPGSTDAAAYDLALIVGDSDIQALATIDGHVVVLSRGSLARVDAADGTLRLGADNPVGPPLGDSSYARWELISDGHRLWAVSIGRANRVYRIDPATLRLGPLITVPGRVVDAAGLDGRLYLNTDSGVYAVPPGEYAASAQPVTRGGQTIAADPARHRLLLIDHDDGWSIRAYSPTRHATVARADLPADAQSVAVADGAIWVVGAQVGRLLRLDPDTLQVISQAALRPPANAPPSLVAGGKDLWIRDGEQLWCVNARTGAVAQHWATLPGAITSRAGQALIGEGNVVGRLRLDPACAG